MPPAEPLDPTRGAPGRWFLLGAALLLLAVGLFIVWPFRAAVLFALLFAYLLQPVYRWLLKGVKKPWIASFLVVILVLVALLIPTGYLGFRVVQEARDVGASLQSGDSLETRAAEALARVGVDNGTARDAVRELQSQATGALQGMVVPALQTLAHATLALILFFILMYFTLIDWPKLVEFARHNLPLGHARADRLLTRIGGYVKAIVLGVFVVALIQGGIAALAWWVLGMPQPVFWGFAMFVAEILPFLGAFVVLLPAAVWQFSIGNTFNGVALLVLNFIIVGLVDDFIRPYLIGERSNVHPAVVLVGIAGGALTFGVVGVVLGPLLLGITAPIIEAWAHPDTTPLKDPRDEDED